MNRVPCSFFSGFNISPHCKAFLGWGALSVLLISCGSAAQAPPVRSGGSAAGSGAESGLAAGDVNAQHQSPVELRVSDLTIDPDRTVRITARVDSILGMRLVPPKVIFKISDSQETITVLINEKVTLKEGMKIELVGHYKTIPSPMYTGPGEAPKEAVFVVDRFLDIP